MDKTFCQVCREDKENVSHNFATGEDTCSECFLLLVDSLDAVMLT